MSGLKETKEAIVSKAQELGTKYADRYKGCGQCTFMAIIDSLRWGGFEIIPKDIEEKLFSGICVLTGGISMTGDGTCGAVTSSVLSIGLALDIRREGQDDTKLRSGCEIVRNTILEKYYAEYRSILCKDVQRKFFGKAWDLTSDKMSQEFLGITQGCTIQQTAGWTVKIILDEIEKGNIKLPHN